MSWQMAENHRDNIPFMSSCATLLNFQCRKFDMSAVPYLENIKDVNSVIRRYQKEHLLNDTD